MAGNIKAGQAYVEIATKQGSFDKGMAQVQAAMSRLKGVATTMGTGIAKGFAGAQGALSGFSSKVLNLPTAIAGSVAVTGLVALAKGFADAGSAVDDMAQRTGMSAEAVSSLGYAAKLSGTDIGTLEKGVRKMQVGIADAAAGVPGAVDKFAALGLPPSPHMEGLRGEAQCAGAQVRFIEGAVLPLWEALRGVIEGPLGGGGGGLDAPIGNLRAALARFKARSGAPPPC